MSSSGRRFSYATRPMQQRRSAPAVSRKDASPPPPSLIANLGDSDKFLFGIIGAGIIVALLLDAGVHLFSRQSRPGLERLQINGRTYVPLP